MRNPMLSGRATIENDSRIRKDDEAQGLGDMILRMSEPQHLHIYIAYKEQKPYITPAGQPAPNAAAAPQPLATSANGTPQ